MTSLCLAVDYCGEFFLERLRCAGLGFYRGSARGKMLDWRVAHSGARAQALVVSPCFYRKLNSNIPVTHPVQDWQGKHAACSAHVTPNRRILVQRQVCPDLVVIFLIDLHMAVGLGDVIIEPEDIYGHAVNVVARIEGLAAPGGICVSADIWGLVRGAISADFVDPILSFPNI